MRMFLEEGKIGVKSPTVTFLQRVAVLFFRRLADISLA